MKKNLEVVYIAGPFRAANSWLVEQNIRRAEEVAYECATFGHAVMCPHANTRFYDGTLTDEYWLAATMELMKRCDFVVLVDQFCYLKSEGTKEEIKVAKKLGMPIYYYDKHSRVLCEFPTRLLNGIK